MRLCELIDNGIDSFGRQTCRANLSGIPSRSWRCPVRPRPVEVRASYGSSTTAPGLDRDGLADALRAGFSGKNRYDTLGLFGMGFNIATGKLGRHTTVITARRSDDFALRVVSRPPDGRAQRAFEVPVEVDRQAG